MSKKALIITVLLFLSISLFPSMAEEAEDWIAKGLSAARQGDYVNADIYFTTATELDPGNIMAWYYRGDALENLKKHDGALECYNKVIEINPSYIDAWYHRGNIFLILKDYENALSCYDKVLEINPSRSDAAKKREEALQFIPGQVSPDTGGGQVAGVFSDTSGGSSMPGEGLTGVTPEELMGKLKEGPGVIFCAAGKNPYAVACIDGGSHGSSCRWELDVPVVFLALRPDGKELWCISSDIMDSCSTDFPITIINPETGKVLDRIACPSAGKIAFTPDGRKAYISLPFGNEIAVYDVEKHCEINRIQVGDHPYDISVSFDGTKAYVGHGCVFTGDFSAYQDMASQFENMDPEDIDMSQFENMDFSSMGGIEPGSKFVAVIDVASDKVSAKVSLEGWSSSVAVSPDGNILYATVNSMDMSVYTEEPAENPEIWNGVAVIDTNSLSVIRKITFTTERESPSVVAFTPDGRKVYAIFGSDDVAIPINVSTHQPGQPIILDLGG